MKHIFGQHLQSVRRARRVSQHVLARALGVRQQTISQWERGDRPFPQAHLNATCAALGVPEESLTSVSGTSDVPTLFDGGTTKRVKDRPRYEIGAYVEHMTSTGAVGQALADHARSRLSANEYDELAHRFPRDTPHELQFAFHVVSQTTAVVKTSPGRFRFPLNCLHDCDWTDGRDLLQPALVWAQGDERMVVFGQVWLNLPWHDPVRPDFLVYYKKKGLPGFWFWVEIDDDGHRDKRYRDQVKALALNMAGLRYENYTVTHANFFERFLRDVRGLREAARQCRGERRRRARQNVARRRATAQERLAKRGIGAHDPRPQ